MPTPKKTADINKVAQVESIRNLPKTNKKSSSPPDTTKRALLVVNPPGNLRTPPPLTPRVAALSSSRKTLLPAPAPPSERPGYRPKNQPFASRTKLPNLPPAPRPTAQASTRYTNAPKPASTPKLTTPPKPTGPPKPPSLPNSTKARKPTSVPKAASSRRATTPLDPTVHPAPPPTIEPAARVPFPSACGSTTTAPEPTVQWAQLATQPICRSTGMAPPFSGPSHPTNRLAAQHVIGPKPQRVHSATGQMPYLSGAQRGAQPMRLPPTQQLAELTPQFQPSGIPREPPPLTSAWATAQLSGASDFERLLHGRAKLIPLAEGQGHGYMPNSSKLPIPYHPGNTQSLGPRQLPPVVNVNSPRRAHGHVLWVERDQSPPAYPPVQDPPGPGSVSVAPNGVMQSWPTPWNSPGTVHPIGRIDTHSHQVHGHQEQQLPGQQHQGVYHNVQQYQGQHGGPPYHLSGQQGGGYQLHQFRPAPDQEGQYLGYIFPQNQVDVPRERNTRERSHRAQQDRSISHSPKLKLTPSTPPDDSPGPQQIGAEWIDPHPQSGDQDRDQAACGSISPQPVSRQSTRSSSERRHRKLEGGGSATNRHVGQAPDPETEFPEFQWDEWSKAPVRMRHHRRCQSWANDTHVDSDAEETTTEPAKHGCVKLWSSDDMLMATTKTRSPC